MKTVKRNMANIDTGRTPRRAESKLVDSTVWPRSFILLTCSIVFSCFRVQLVNHPQPFVTFSFSQAALDVSCFRGEDSALLQRGGDSVWSLELYTDMSHVYMTCLYRKKKFIDCIGVYSRNRDYMWPNQSSNTNRLWVAMRGISCCWKRAKVDLSLGYVT